jgi:hypothetical protein
LSTITFVFYRSWNSNLKLAGILVGGYASRVFLAVPVVVGVIVSTLIRQESGMESICGTAFAGYNGLGNRPLRAQTNLLVAGKRLVSPNPLIVGLRGGPS